jgi:hypothetical protein
MSRRSWLSVLILLLAALGAGAEEPGSTDETDVDPRVRAALDAAKLGYIVDEGDFRLKYDVAGGRTQLVWVASDTAKIDQLEIRDVWSIASRGKGAPPAELASYLLKENARMILGAWQVNQGPEEYLVVFSAPVSATADAATLQEVIEVVMLSADRIEKELTGKDEF